jgi:hypothetical protein
LAARSATSIGTEFEFRKRLGFLHKRLEGFLVTGNVTKLASFGAFVMEDVAKQLKLTDEQFPYAEVEAAGYHAAVHGQPTYNGVAILSRTPYDNTLPWLVAKGRTLADAGYASALDLFDCAQAKVDLYAPYQENDRTEQRRAKQPDRPNHGPGGADLVHRQPAVLDCHATRIPFARRRSCHRNTLLIPKSFRGRFRSPARL